MNVAGLLKPTIIDQLCSMGLALEPLRNVSFNYTTTNGVTNFVVKLRIQPSGAHYRVLVQSGGTVIWYVDSFGGTTELIRGVARTYGGSVSVYNGWIRVTGTEVPDVKVYDSRIDRPGAIELSSSAPLDTVSVRR
jgi:hypothetical protein